MGQDHLASLLPHLRNAGGEALVVVLDFGGIDAANGSYLKATALWLLRAGAAAAAIDDGHAREAPSGIEALNVFPVATNLNSEVRDDLDMLLRSEQLPLLAGEMARGLLERAEVLGHLDPALKSTLAALAKEKRATATDLCERFPQKPPIKSPAWSNRLSELHRLRLARREKEGRQWFYASLANEAPRG
jgi:hypothetical protein